MSVSIAFFHINSVDVVSPFLIVRCNFVCQDLGKVRRKGLRASWFRKQNCINASWFLFATSLLPSLCLKTPCTESLVLFLQRIHLLCPMGERQSLDYIERK